MTKPNVHFIVTLLLLICLLPLLPAPIYADEGTAPEPVVRQTDQGIEVVWQNRDARRATGTATWQSWPTVDVGGLNMPATLIAVHLHQEGAGEIQIDALDARSWLARSHPFAPAALPTHTLPTGESLPSLAPTAAPPSLPDAPVLMLRRGQMRGQHIGVLAVVPLYQAEDGIREVRELRFSVEGASPWSEAGHTLQADAWQQPWISTEGVPGPAALASQRALKLIVTQPGIQEVAITAIRATGLLDQAAPSQLQLYHREQPVALEEDPAKNALRFYAPAPGDRWNQSDVYWLTVEETPGLRMETRPARTIQGTREAQDWAWEPGEWYHPTLYVSQQPGPDADHWFSGDLRAAPDLPTTAVTLSLPLGLPPLDATGTFTLTGSATISNAHALQIHTIGLTTSEQKTITWRAGADWVQSAPFAADTHTMLATLQAGARPDGLRLDRLTWLRPVSLAFGRSGGTFQSSESPARYRLRTLPLQYRLYDITEPDKPSVVQTEHAGADTGLLLDSEGRRRYLLVPVHQAQIYLPAVQRGSANLPATAAAIEWLNRSALIHQPEIRLHQPYDWQPALDADLIYIAPDQFTETLAPLVVHRQTQGYRVAVVDVQAVYDAWSGGSTSPEAIRAFLRYAAANGARAPRAVTLVGDGTRDPRNYTERNNTNFVPPYLAMVDPWLGETACETCYAQLDGPDPLNDPLPDLFLGRLPVKSEVELQHYVDKLLAYERNSRATDTRSHVLYVTDNFRNADGSVDNAGDFSLVAEKSAALHPSGIHIDRLYYDPSPTHTQAPWREPDAVTAHQRTMAALESGAGFATYIGHAHHWQWASTDLNADPPYLLGLYDVDLLTNRERLPILLEMTCLTAAFHEPAFSGTTIDERFVLHKDGGAAAVWGPTGLGVSYGHEALQRGFFQAYWDRQNQDKSLGALVQAGYLALFTRGDCCQSTLRTYALLGDSLTVPQVEAGYKMRLPFVTR